MTKKAKPVPQIERDRYQEVTDKIIAIMEQGKKPWVRGWNKTGSMAAPVNATTGKRYRGINHIILMANELSMETGDPRWCTFQQAVQKKWNVKKGSQAEIIVFYKQVPIKNKVENSEDEDSVTRTIPILKAFPVFHASQIEGIPEYTRPERPKPVEADHDWSVIDDAELIAKNSQARILIGGDSAFYNPISDHIGMPSKEQFHSPEHYAATLLHELGHWTSHPDRLDRKISGLRQNRTEYAKEELRAELASAFIGAELDLTSDLQNHASYLDSWLQSLRDDKREIFRAARDAQLIADYILNFHPSFDFEIKSKNENDVKAAVEDDEVPTMAMAI